VRTRSTGQPRLVRRGSQLARISPADRAAVRSLHAILLRASDADTGMRCGTLSPRELGNYAREVRVASVACPEHQRGSP
jgi:hypothetical protein